MVQPSGFTTAYRSESSRSKQLYDRATQVMPGGNSRHSIVFAPYPIYVHSGQGCRVTDVEGQERIDFINNATVAILGHANPQVMEAVAKQFARGASFAMPTEAEVDLASLLVERIDYLDKVRFCNSGSEAVMLCVKAARAFTGRPKIAKIEGAYHGSYDYAQVSLAPTPEQWGDPWAPASVAGTGSAPSVKDDVVVMPWNNTEACVALIEKHKEHLAAVLLDPLPSALGMIAPRPGFLETIRKVTREYDILLIADEVISLRLSYQGGCYEFGIKPDLVAMGKIIGGGFPVGSVGGSDEVMEIFDHTRPGKQWVQHAGTFNANPMTMTAGLATMRLMTPEAFDRLNRMGDYIRDRIGDLIARKEFPAQVTGKGSLFWVHLTNKELVDYRSFVNASHDWPLSDSLAHQMLDRGIVCINRDFGCLSTPMEKEELDAYVDALDASLEKLRL